MLFFFLPSIFPFCFGEPLCLVLILKVCYEFFIVRIEWLNARLGDMLVRLKALLWAARVVTSPPLRFVIALVRMMSCIVAFSRPFDSFSCLLMLIIDTSSLALLGVCSTFRPI